MDIIISVLVVKHLLNTLQNIQWLKWMLAYEISLYYFSTYFIPSIHFIILNKGIPLAIMYVCMYNILYTI